MRASRWTWAAAAIVIASPVSGFVPTPHRAPCPTSSSRGHRQTTTCARLRQNDDDDDNLRQSLWQRHRRTAGGAPALRAASHSMGPHEQKKTLGARLRSLPEAALLAALGSVVAALFAVLIKTRAATPPPFFALREILAGGAAAALAEVALYPLEVLKVRRQTRDAASYRQVLFTWRRAGAFAGALRALAYHGLRLGLFPSIKRLLLGGSGGSSAPWVLTYLPAALHALLSKVWSVANRVVVGAACGAVGAFLCNPLDLAKTRLQRDASRYRNSVDALVTIPAREGGLKALWVGAAASITRAAAGSAAQLSTYDLVKATRGRTDALAVLAGALVSTVAYVSATAPFDVVKTRLMVAGSASGEVHHNLRRSTDAKKHDSSEERRERRYTAQSSGGSADNSPPGLLGAVRAICRDEGFFALFAGWVPAFLRLLPTTLVVFPLLERFRVMLGTGAF